MQGLRSSFRFVSGVALPLFLATFGCSSSSSPPSGSGASNGSGGKTGTGGRAGSGGVTGSGGKSGSGGSQNGGSNGKGGAQGSGGTSSGGQCSNVAPCGGDVVGAWTVASSCITVTGSLDLSLAGAGCPSAPVTGSLKVEGTWTATADGKFTDNTVTTGSEQFTLGPSCLVISSTPVTCDGAASLLASTLGYSEATCNPIAGGGCNCSATVKQTGGLGVLSMSPSTSDRYKTSGNLLTLAGDLGDTEYEYCASGNKLTVTPKVATPTLTGTIVLEKSGSSGSGGTTGSGGQSGSGGKTGCDRDARLVLFI